MVWKMRGSNKFRNFISYILGLMLVSFGIYLILKHPHVDYVINLIGKGVELREGTPGYKVWKDLNISFPIWLFHVKNPDDVMDGGFPKFQERGPYVYDLNLKKLVTSIDIERDELNFTVVRTYRFNPEKSGDLSENDEITILNTAYLGTISMIATNFAAFLGKFGNPITNLFPGMEDIFLRGKVRDILFDGLPLVCDPNNKDLKLICTGLKSKKPPIIKNTDTENVYSYSFFDSLNGTGQGPFTVNRGVKIKTSLGNTTSYKGKRNSKLWNEEQCNVISGTDSITWPPMPEKLPFVTVFEPTLCRTVKPYFKKEVIIHGLKGYRYELQANAWNDDVMKCYCPVNKKKELKCLQTGLMDISKCQEAPIIYSEPHFLHADGNLGPYAGGVSENEEVHSTFITIEPISGAPLSGSKKIQLNMKLINVPSVKFLTNVSEGYFPVLWAAEESVASVELLSSIIHGHRLLNIFNFFSWIPILMGILWFIKIFLYHDSDVHPYN